MTRREEIPMHDIKAIRDDPATFVRGLTRRGMADAATVADDLLKKDKALRDLLVRLQTAQARRNEASKLIGQAKAKKDEARAAALMAESINTWGGGGALASSAPRTAAQCDAWMARKDGVGFVCLCVDGDVVACRGGIPGRERLLAIKFRETGAWSQAAHYLRLARAMAAMIKLATA